MTQMCLISTLSLKYTYLHMNLCTGARIRQGLPKRELVKKAPTNLLITSGRVSRQQADTDQLVGRCQWVKICSRQQTFTNFLKTIQL